MLQWRHLTSLWLDPLLSRADSAIGFNWPAWFELISANPRLHSALAYAYLSFPVQISVLILYFSYADPKRVHERLLAGMLSVLFIVPIMVLLPAVGAWSQYGVGVVEPWRHDILALRAHTLVTIGETKGIVSFPSFHTAMAVLLINMARGRKWSLPVLILNLLMIAAVPTEGAHYGVDVVSGTRRGAYGARNHAVRAGAIFPTGRPSTSRRWS